MFDTPNRMTINQAPMHVNLKVSSFSVHETRELSDIESRLMHLGFIQGAHIKIKKRAPLFGEPFLIEVRGRLVAMSLSEALLVEVEVAQ